MYLKSIVIDSSKFPVRNRYPFNIRAINESERIDISSSIAIFTGENGSGKSALLDAVARKSGFLPWGGSKIHRAHRNPFETQLANHVILDMEPRRPYGFHFRAEAFFNFAASLDDILLDDPGRDEYYGGGSLNVLSHGESFLAFFRGYSFQLGGLYILDEPEAALSPQNQVEFVRILMNNVLSGNKQYVIATLSPIILACPGAQILSFDNRSIQPLGYEQTTTYNFYKEFMSDPMKYFVI